jgi:hypothetical protein
MPDREGYGTEKLIRQYPHSRPREYVGQARQFRAAIAVEDAVATKAIAKIVAPLHARALRHPVPRPADLVDAARSWRLTVPAGNRLALNIDAARTRLQIDELCVSAIDFKFTDWPDDDFEPGVSVLHVRLRAAPHVLELEAPIVACASLHAPARRFQRGSSFLAGE